MKAAILIELNRPLLVTDEIEIPSLGIGQVLVRVHRSGICGAQIGEIAGAKGEDKYLPHLLGHEGGGVVAEVGEGITQVKRGDHVVMHWRKSVGIEAQPPIYKYNGGYMGGGWVTTFNEYAVVSENRLTPINKDIPFEIAALMGCAVTTALGLINNEAHLKIGQSIAVAGCGGVGLNVIQGAAMVSANPIIAIDIYQHKLDKAKELGATHIINSSEVNIIEEVHKIIGSTGIDVFVECTGAVEIIEQGYTLTAANGRMVLVGQPYHDKKLSIPLMRRHYCGKTLLDSQGGLTNPVIDIPRYLNLYRDGKLKLDNLITHHFPLDLVNNAIEMIKSGKTGRCMLVME
jgi:S-(hydroxymethyl)glutathione dehydrogenase/alcohol dehydrogenase